jgi:hypothetical protein
MITTSENDVTVTITANAYHGIHGTGMVERGYEAITLRASDYESDEAQRTGDDKQQWWADVLASFADYQRLVAESFPDSLELRARSLGFQSFADWTEGLSEANDLEQEADLCRQFLAAEAQA